MPPGWLFVLCLNYWWVASGYFVVSCSCIISFFFVITILLVCDVLSICRVLLLCNILFGGFCCCVMFCSFVAPYGGFCCCVMFFPLWHLMDVLLFGRVSLFYDVLLFYV